MTKDSYGKWEITVPAVSGNPAIQHNSKIKVRSNLDIEALSLNAVRFP